MKNCIIVQGSACAFSTSGFRDSTSQEVIAVVFSIGAFIPAKSFQIIFHNMFVHETNRF